MDHTDRIARRLTLEDRASWLALGEEAFGARPPGSSALAPPVSQPPGLHRWGVVEGGRVLAQVVGRACASWWGGQAVGTTGIASVAVAAEHRGEGLLRGVFERVLAEALERGEVVSTLYPTAPGIYRGLGYELVATLDAVDLPTAALAAVRPGVGVSTRRATPDDVPALRELYTGWAREQHGPLTRTGPLYEEAAEEAIADHTGTTLAVDAGGRVLGCVRWDRGEGYDPATARLTARDLLATTPEAYRALWAVLGSFATVAGTVRLWTSGADEARLVLPGVTWQPVDRRPYMLRVLDLVGAVEARQLTLPLGGAGGVTLRVAGDRLGVLDGGYRLAVESGAPATCERVSPPEDAPTLTPQGVALWWAGAQSCATLRRLGHLTGPTDGDELLDALTAGAQLHVRDYF
ncbi:GNAT family N-acetyltransferase [Nocardioides nanhaiensis]|uniref:GNAT family N-acetyltransferase n=1 Tax=Nocardioides nanhaiensis TaxID=1476871 RepID=UPI0031EB1319